MTSVIDSGTTYDAGYCIDDQIHIISSKRIETPVLIGFLRPVIVIPTEELTTEKLNFIISHELIHVSHRDILFKYFFELVLSIYWWLIPMYFLRDKVNQMLELRVAQEITENVSDDEKIRYIETLIKIAKISNHYYDYSALTIGFSSCESELHRRTKSILRDKYTSKWTRTTIIVLLAYFFFSTSIIFEPYSVDKVTKETTF